MNINKYGENKRRCVKCKEIKEICNFSGDKGRYLGKSYLCKTCSRIKGKNRPKRVLTYEQKIVRKQQQLKYSRKFIINTYKLMDIKKFNNEPTLIETSNKLKIIMDMQKHKCNYCDIDLHNIPKGNGKTRSTYHLDHKDANRNNWSYVNLQFLCWSCNVHKLDMPHSEEIKMLIGSISKMRWNSSYFELRP
jgi:uncharacterized ubiquitin-like protein YukD